MSSSRVLHPKVIFQKSSSPLVALHISPQQILLLASVSQLLVLLQFLFFLQVFHHLSLCRSILHKTTSISLPQFIYKSSSTHLECLSLVIQKSSTKSSISCHPQLFLLKSSFANHLPQVHFHQYSSSDPPL